MTRLAIVLPLLLACCLPAVAESPKLNVLFVAVDDLRCEMGCWGQDYMVTPNIDRLAARGVRFTRTYCQQALCNPSRNSLVSGTRPDAFVSRARGGFYRTALPEVVALPQHFSDHGYYTRAFGKILHHNGCGDERLDPQYDPICWSEEMFWPTGGMYALRPDIFSRSMHLETWRPTAIPKPNKPLTEMADVDDDAYRDGMVAREAIRTLNRVADRPFFLAVGFFKPHTPFNAPKRYWDLYDPAKIRLAANPDPPRDVPQVAMYDWQYIRSFRDMPEAGPMPDDQARHLLHAYYAATSYMDAQLGRVLDELDRLDLTDETIVLFWSDHGYMLGEHGIWGKHTNFEDATLTPMIVSTPGGKNAGGRCDALVELVDVYPTLSELCGLPLPDHLEGTSFAPLIENPKRPWKSAAFSQYRRGGTTGYSMRTERYRYTEWQNPRTGEVAARELYDHTVDPDENQNLATDPSRADLIDRLSAKLAAGWKAANPASSGDASHLR